MEISELDDISEKECMDNMRERLRDMEERVRKPNICLFWALEVNYRENGEGETLKKIMAKNFARLLKDINPQINMSNKSWIKQIII